MPATTSRQAAKVALSSRRRKATLRNLGTKPLAISHPSRDGRSNAAARPSLPPRPRVNRVPSRFAPAPHRRSRLCISLGFSALRGWLLGPRYSKRAPSCAIVLGSASVFACSPLSGRRTSARVAFVPSAIELTLFLLFWLADTVWLTFPETRDFCRISGWVVEIAKREIRWYVVDDV